MISVFFRTLARAGALTAGLLGLSGAAWAADLGTNAGTVVQNQATVAYSVGGAAQTPITSDDPTVGGTNDPTTFVVDRRVNLTVSEIGTTTTIAQPNTTDKITAFRLQNLTNATLDFDLTVGQLSNGTANAAHGGDDTFNVTNVRIYIDVNQNGTLETGTDTLLTTGSVGVQELVEDGSIDILVVADIPSSASGVAGVTLTATARAGGDADAFGAVLTNDDTAADDPTVVQNVFADAAGPVTGDAQYDGEASDDDDYTAQPLPGIVKTGKVISDPINNTTNQKAIPGATVEYCVRIENSGPLPITVVNVADPIPANTTYAAGTLFVGGTVTSGECDANGTAANDAYSAGTDDNGFDTSTNPSTIRALIPTVASGTTTTVRFRVTIN